MKEETNYKLVVEIMDSESPFIKIRYSNFLYSENYINRIIDSYISILKQFCQNPLSKYPELDVLNSNDKKILIEDFNNTAKIINYSKSLWELYNTFSNSFQNNVAIEFADKKLTYEELNNLAEDFYYYLSSNDCGKKKQLIGILADGSIEAIVAILAIVKMGHTYVPLDTKIPVSRLKKIVDNAPLDMLVCKENFNHEIINNNCRILTWKDFLKYRSANSLKENLPPVASRSVKETDPVYIIYTSGSTGEPKGVMVSHASCVNYLLWGLHYYLKGLPGNFPLFTNLSFDLTVTSIWLPLLSGGKIKINQGSLISILDNSKSDGKYFIKMTPSHLSILLEQIEEIRGFNCNVDAIILGGEQLQTELAAKAKKLLNNPEIYNEYGPTEATVGCMIYEYTGAEIHSGPVSIGRPISNSKIFVLDDYFKSVPVGCPGEIYIGGDVLALGYLNRKDLTSEKFIQNPSIEYGYLYKTGDYGYFTEEGLLYFMERKDNQMKLHGYRIEANEISSAILTIPEVLDAVTVIKKDEKNHPYIISYYKSKELIDENRIRDQIKKDLPSYMNPGFIKRMDSFPLTSNGKLDKKALPDIKSLRNQNDQILETKDDMEQMISAVFQDVLSIKSIKLNQNFFDLGADSIHIMRINSKLQMKIKKTINVVDFFENPTIKKLALYINNRSGIISRDNTLVSKRSRLAGRRESRSRR